jgi:hypothetical protein
MNRSRAFAGALLSVLAGVAIWRVSALVADDTPGSSPAPAAAIDIAKLGHAPRHGPPPTAWTRPLFGRDTDRDATVAKGPGLERSPGKEIPRLIGVALDGEHRVAVLSHNNVVVRVRQGEHVGQWTLVQINMRSAVMRVGQQSEVLELDR